MLNNPPSDIQLYWRWLSVGAFSVGLGMTAWSVIANTEPNPRHPAIVTTAWMSFALWAGAIGLMVQAGPGEWVPTTARFRVTRWTWVLAATMFVIHFLLAFHFAHRWRHENAIRHVEVTTGFGPGLFVSYFFTIVWVVDAIWLCVGPTSYASRPRWLGWTIHTFMTFITFNATAVFAHGLMRWVSIGVFGVLVWYWLMGMRKVTRPSSRCVPE